MPKILEKAKAVFTGWAGLPDAVKKGDESAVRRILADHDVDVRMAAILLLIPGEAERLKKVIEKNNDLGNPEELSFELGALSRYTPRSAEEAAATAKAIADCKKRKDINWFGGLERQRAESELACLRHIFSEVFDGTAGKKAANLGLPSLISNALNIAGLDRDQLTKAPWIEAFGRAPAQPKKRLRLLAR